MLIWSLMVTYLLYKSRCTHRYYAAVIMMADPACPRAAFCPYHIGHFAIMGFRVQDMVMSSHFEGLLTTLVGYCIIGLMLVLLHTAASVLSMNRCFCGPAYRIVTVLNFYFSVMLVFRVYFVHSVILFINFFFKVRDSFIRPPFSASCVMKTIAGSRCIIVPFPTLYNDHLRLVYDHLLYILVICCPQSIPITASNRVSHWAHNTGHTPQE